MDVAPVNATVRTDPSGSWRIRVNAVVRARATRRPLGGRVVNEQPRQTSAFDDLAETVEEGEVVPVHLP